MNAATLISVNALALLVLGCGARSDLAIEELDATEMEPGAPARAALFVGLTAGDVHSCGVTDVGTVWCWGGNRRGDLGLGTMDTDPHPPTRVPGLADIVGVSASRTTCVVRGDGAVFCWGTGEDRIFGADTSVRVSSPQQIDGVTEAVEVSVGNGHACVLRRDATVWCWGNNTCGQLGHDSDDADFVPPAPVAAITDAAQVSAGACHTCVRLTDGSLRCWGNNTSGQLGVEDAAGPRPVAPDLPGPAVDVRADAACTCSTGDLGVHCWGSGTYGALGTGDTLQRSTPALVAGVGPSQAVTTSCATTCAAERDGTLLCWGLSGFGRLGYDEEDEASVLEPIVHPSVRDATALSAGSSHTCALLGDGRIQCWGRNQHGQLGDGRSEHHGELTTLDAALLTP